MKFSIKKVAIALTAIMGASVLAPLSAQAITGGEPDGEGHRNVGMILFYDAGGRYRCTATLVSPTILLTAGHCTDGTVGETLVTFDSVIAEEPPSGFPVASNPAAGYTEAELTAAGYISGTAHTHPDYSGFTDMDNWNDVGVIELNEPVTDIEPAPIASLNYLDQYAQPLLNSTLFTAVGYGVEMSKNEDGPQQPYPQSYPLIRRVAEEPGQKLTPQLIQTNGNFNDIRGTGGTCFGDSGGPLLHDGKIVAVTSYGYTSNCRYLDGSQRVDIAGVQDWLDDFGL